MKWRKRWRYILSQHQVEHEVYMLKHTYEPQSPIKLYNSCLLVKLTSFWLKLSPLLASSIFDWFKKLYLNVKIRIIAPLFYTKNTSDVYLGLKYIHISLYFIAFV